MAAEYEVLKSQFQMTASQNGQDWNGALEVIWSNCSAEAGPFRSSHQADCSSLLKKSQTPKGVFQMHLGPYTSMSPIRLVPSY